MELACDFLQTISRKRDGTQAAINGIHFGCDFFKALDTFIVYSIQTGKLIKQTGKVLMLLIKHFAMFSLPLVEFICGNFQILKCLSHKIIEHHIKFINNLSQFIDKGFGRHLREFFREFRECFFCCLPVISHFLTNKPYLGHK